MTKTTNFELYEDNAGGLRLYVIGKKVKMFADLEHQTENIREMLDILADGDTAENWETSQGDAAESYEQDSQLSTLIAAGTVGKSESLEVWLEDAGAAGQQALQ